MPIGTDTDKVSVLLVNTPEGSHITLFPAVEVSITILCTVVICVSTDYMTHPRIGASYFYVYPLQYAMAPVGLFF